MLRAHKDKLPGEPPSATARSSWSKVRATGDSRWIFKRLAQGVRVPPQFEAEAVKKAAGALIANVRYGASDDASQTVPDDELRLPRGFSA
jgi:hypothetical protein